MYHNEQSVAIRQTHCHRALLIVRVIGIGDRDRERIGKYRCSFVKTNPVLSKVLSRFTEVPLKLYRHWNRLRQDQRTVVKEFTRAPASFGSRVYSSEVVRFGSYVLFLCLIR